jgi:osmotically inducible protein OsmC
MKPLYSTKVTAVGGRSGSVKSDDGLLDLTLALPEALGGKGGATNPEQLFAAGYAACFENAVIHVSRAQNKRVNDDDIKVVADVALVSNGNGSFSLTVLLDVEIIGVDQETAESIVAQAHDVCPYSNAVKGNIDVQLKISAQ